MRSDAAGADAYVLDLRRSPWGALKSVPVQAVSLRDAFWSPRLTANREQTIPSQLSHCEETGRLDNFRRVAGTKSCGFRGIYFNDSDVYKWLEAASWSLAASPDSTLEASVDGVVEVVGSAQDADGYLNTYFSLERKGDRFSNLKDMHEIYCAGHLFQAAVAHARATGKRTLLEIATRLADHLYAKFGPQGRLGACGHEEAEMGLVELGRTTGDPRYLELAARMIDARGQEPRLLGGSAYHQDHRPFREQTEMTGHAVRHTYLCCGAADVAAETGDAGLMRALDVLWNNFTEKKMYVTGGAGARWEGEAFGEDYELPNERAYTETCAAIGSVMWNYRMLHLTGHPQYADVMEMALYNAVLPGVSLDGQRYFYQNPLADRGKHRREEWFGCACCPPNVARLLASLPAYFYSTSSEGVYVHLYAQSDARMALEGGDCLEIRQVTDYPWSGAVSLHIDAAPAHELTLFLRIPFWADAELTKLQVNGEDAAALLPADGGSYCAIRRAWRPGDTVRLELPMPVEMVESHPRVLANRGRVALQRGPLIYCVEQADHSGCDAWDLAVRPDTDFAVEKGTIGGQEMLFLRADAVQLDSGEWEEALYAPYAGPELQPPAALTAIPYFAWANRDPGPMIVWLPVTSEQ